VNSGLVNTADNSTPSEIDMTQMVPVTVDGVTTQVTLQEAANGYASRQMVTQATTRAAELQKQVEAFDRFKTQLRDDPERIVSGLAERFQVNISPTRASDDYPDDDSESDSELVEVKKQVAELSRQIAHQQNQLATKAHENEIETKLAGLQQAHGDAFNKDKVLNYALVNDINDVETAFKAWRFDEGLSTPSSDSTLDSAVQALGHIAPGAPTATPTPAKAAHEAPKDIRESLRRAYAAADMDMDEILSSV
jgi:hypothetical protein